MIKKEVFYSKRTIVSFIVITLISLGITFVMDFGMSGATWLGIPFAFGTGGTSTPEMAAKGIEYNFFYLFLDLLVYYALAIVISNHKK